MSVNGDVSALRQMSTGSVLWESTLTASLPSSNLPRPRLPCDAITIKSQWFFSAISKMPSAGYWIFGVNCRTTDIGLAGQLAHSQKDAGRCFPGGFFEFLQWNAECGLARDHGCP